MKQDDAGDGTLNQELAQHHQVVGAAFAQIGSDFGASTQLLKRSRIVPMIAAGSLPSFWHALLLTQNGDERDFPTPSGFEAPEHPSSGQHLLDRASARS